MFDPAPLKSVSTPFGAVVGQARLKEALLAVAVDDSLDGLLVTGEKGTAKSTLVRGLAELLPEQRAIADCPYGCPPGDRKAQCSACRERASYPVETRPVPLVTLPLGASRDRVVGTLSVSDALSGEASFDPGLLARANRGLLYVDEVNLLDDHLVDVLLDAAASGENRVERDGVSVTHPAEFTLVGTMNPEEGDLRPQLRDRFALSVEVHGERDIEDRVAIIEHELGGSASTSGADDTERHRTRLRTARELLDQVTLTDEQKAEIAALCLESGVDGHRGDIATARTARVLAALEGRPTVTDGDLRQAASFALAHRMRSTPFEDAPDAEDVIDDHFEDAESDTETGDNGTEEGADTDADADTDTNTENREERDGETDERTDSPEREAGNEAGKDGSTADTDGGNAPEIDEKNGQRTPEPAGRSDTRSRSEATGEQGTDQERSESDGEDEGEHAEPLMPGQPRQPAEAAAPDIEPPSAETGGGSGRASATASTGHNGVRVRSERTDTDGSVDVAASARAAAVRGGDGIETRDLRESVRATSGDALVVFAVDASASMRPAMAATKGVALALLEGAYTERDTVAVVAFAGDSAEVILPPTDSVSLAARHLKELPVGDRTPLPAGLRTATSVIERADPDAAVTVLVSDGRANAGSEPTAETRTAAESLAATGTDVICVDAGDGRGLLSDVVAATDGTLIELGTLTPERVEQELLRSRE